MRSSKKKEAFRELAVMAASVLILASCNRSSPTEPKLMVSTSWSVTRTVTSVSGPDICLPGIPLRGQSEQGVFELRRRGDFAAFIFFDTESSFSNYTGTMAGTVFTASRAEGYICCNCVNFNATSNLSGRFSEDGSHLTASEVWTWTLDSGQVKTFTFEWSANRG